MYRHILATSGVDRVVAAAPVVTGGRFLSMSGVTRVVGAGDNNIATAVYWAMKGAFFASPDPDVANNDDVLWDLQVPKDQTISFAAGAEIVDFDEDTGNVDPFQEPGDTSIETLFAVNVPADDLFNIEGIMTFADTSDGFKDATPDTFIPNVIVPWSSKNVRVASYPSHAMAAFVLPKMDVTSSTPQVALGDEEWVMLQYLDKVLEDAFLAIVGITETGAESPFVDLLAALQAWTEPLVFEETAGAWGSPSANTWTTAVIFTESPGAPVQKMISSGA